MNVHYAVVVADAAADIKTIKKTVQQTNGDNI